MLTCWYGWMSAVYMRRTARSFRTGAIVPTVMTRSFFSLPLDPLVVTRQATTTSTPARNTTTHSNGRRWFMLGHVHHVLHLPRVGEQHDIRLALHKRAHGLPERAGILRKHPLIDRHARD